MWKKIVCDGDAAEREQLIDLAWQCLQGKEVQVTGCTFLAGAGRHGKAGTAGRCHYGAGRRGRLKHHHQRKEPGQKNSLVFRYGLPCACVSRSFAESRYPAKRWSRQFPSL